MLMKLQKNHRYINLDTYNQKARNRLINLTVTSLQIYFFNLSVKGGDLYIGIFVFFPPDNSHPFYTISGLNPC